MEPHATSGGEFHPHLGVVQINLVKARFRPFLLVGETHLPLTAVGNGQERPVAQLTDARATEMQMAEPDEEGVGDMIA